MKKFFKTLLSAVILLCCTGQIVAQPNEATIFVLEDDNLQEVVSDVTNFMNQYASSTPSPLVLGNFLSSVYANRVYEYSPSACPVPATRVFQQGGTVRFEFDNFGSGYPDALFIGELEFADSQKTSEAVYGSSVYEGLSLPLNKVQQHIFLIGSFCSACQSALINQCSSRWEIIIIDKNIL